MYETYWQFERKPFDNTADPRFYYPGEAHQGALLKLRYAIENKRGAAVISAAAGLGKSLLVNTLYRQLPDHFRPRVHLVFPQMSPDQLLSYLAHELDGGQAAAAADSTDVHIRRIEHVLTENARAGNHAVIAIDEAHLLRDLGTRETMRLLLNLEAESQPALTLTH